MKQKKKNIHIIGAGVSGLVAAQILEKEGYQPIVFEATDRVGGRMKTDWVGNIPLDRGFQVLLDQYPMVIKYLDLSQLDLHQFWSGASLYNGQQEYFGDPLRAPFFLFHTLFYKGATLGDKYKIFELNRKLKDKSIEDIFNALPSSTMDYLKNCGFSNAAIEHFFIPFFGGIFLERELKTSSRMFEFVFKMFAEGKACIPKAGMEEIPKQLKSKLNSTKFHFNVDIKEVRDGKLYMEGFDPIESDATIVSCAADDLIPYFRKKSTEWKGCACFYFEVEEFSLNRPVIGLLSKPNVFVNNWHELNWLEDPDKKVISVTVVDHLDLPEDVLLRGIHKEMKEYCGVNIKRLLKSYHIGQALPKLERTDYDIDPEETQLTDKIFIAGDVCLNGSMNAAMLSGQRAAEGVIEHLRFSRD